VNSRTRQLDSEGLWQYGLRALGGRAHSTGQLREKLRRRAERVEDIEEVLARLKDSGFLNDRQFAEGYATARLTGDKFGQSRVIQDLRQRRVAPGLAEDAVKEVYREVDETALIEEWIRKKYRMTPREGLFKEAKDLGTAYRRLVRAGFRTGEIVRVLKRFAKDPDLLDGFEPPVEEEE
jgi:regulatory protein